MQDRELRDGGTLTAILATPSEIGHMSDAQALAKIDQLREASRTADASGRTREARAMLHNATQVADANYVGIEVVAEYADFLEGYGFPEYAAEYRRHHQELTEMLAGHGGPFPAYEKRLREERRGGPSREGQRGLDGVLGQARSAASGTGGPRQPTNHLRLVGGRDQA